MMRAMTRRLGGWAWLGALTLGAVGPAGAQPAIAVVGVRLIDGRGGPPLEGATVLVKDGRIAEVGASDRVRVPAGARIIRGAGMSLLPGLADLHTHLTGGWDGDAADFLGVRRTMGALLYAGITTVLDPGDVTTWVKQLQTEVAAGRLAGPRIYYAGFILDGAKPFWPDISAAIVTDEQIGHFVSVAKQAGSDFVKAYIGLTDGQIKTVVDSAKRQGLRVIADAGGRNGSLGTAQAGIAAFAHAATRPMTDETVRYLVDHGTMSLTTLAVYESFAKRRFNDLTFLDHPLLADVLSPQYQKEIRGFAARPMSAADSAMAQRLSEGFPNAMANVKRMVDAGVLVAAGTDAPYPGVYYGEGLHRELELMVETGLTPLQAITAATANAARFIGPRADWGTIEAGKVADLLLVRGNPAERISDTKNVVTVIQRGRVVDRRRLKYDPATEPDFHPSPLRPH